MKLAAECNKYNHDWRKLQIRLTALSWFIDTVSRLCFFVLFCFCCSSQLATEREWWGRRWREERERGRRKQLPILSQEWFRWWQLCWVMYKESTHSIVRRHILHRWKQLGPRQWASQSHVRIYESSVILVSESFPTFVPSSAMPYSYHDQARKQIPWRRSADVWKPTCSTLNNLHNVFCCCFVLVFFSFLFFFFIIMIFSLSFHHHLL